MKKSIFILLFIFCVSAFAQKPKADFDVNISNSCYSSQTTYVNKSVGAIQYFWKVDDYSFRETYVPRGDYYYYEEKSFKTTLIAVSVDGQRDTISKIINIAPFTKAIIEYEKPDSIRFAPANIQFFNKSYLRQGDDSLTYTWTFGYGNKILEKDPILTFKNPGTYSVELTGKSTKCAVSDYAIITLKDTAQRDEFSFVKMGCNQGNIQFPVPINFGKQYQIFDDTLKVLGIYYGNCGAAKTATVRYKGDTIMIKTWETGQLTTCGCEFYFEIKIPNYLKDSAIIYFNKERIKPMIAAIPHVSKLEQTIRVFPNPVSDNFLLKTDDNSLFPLNLIIKDIDGRKMKEVFLESNNSEINTSELKPGIYVLYLYLKNGFVTKKMIKI